MPSRMSACQMEESNFNYRYVKLCDSNIPREKWQNYLQTVESLIRRRFLTGSALFASYPFGDLENKMG